MAIGVDTSKWKPRKIKGTPAAKVRNILGVSILSFGIICGAYFHFSKYTEGLRKAVEILYEDPIEEVERRKFIAAGLPIYSKETKRQMAEQRDPETTCDVHSKYFCRGGMDDSLLDFQEKKAFSGLKNSQVTKAITSKPKVKKTKKIKGQKDIRTALKGKKNELIAYSNEFDKVCKQSGLDVDPEQLQLAIALSKSLLPESQEDSLQNTKTLTSLERSGKIRTTLKEYGFVVPDTKITVPKSRKLKKYRKVYKLLQTTKEEKQQIIADKYSQVLFNNFERSKTEVSETVQNLSHLYHIVTNILYKHLKDNRVFYTTGVVEHKPNSVGTLLRDWSEIPGRPASPVLEVDKLVFDNLDCSQEELDGILSGTLKIAQEISRSKYNLLPESEHNTNKVNHNNVGKTVLKMDKEFVEIIDLEDRITMESRKGATNASSKPIDLAEVEDINFLSVTQDARSYSPDIFGDDELSSVMENSVHLVRPISQEVLLKNTTKVCNEVMDLTECINTNSQKLTGKQNSQLSQGIDATKRKSNDFMDITECVVGSSQPIREDLNLEVNIDLTQNSNNEDDAPILKENSIVRKENLISMDLTQLSESSEDLPAVHISGKGSLDETIILNEDIYAGLNNKSELIGKTPMSTTCPVSNIERDEKQDSGLTPITPCPSPSANRLSITLDSEYETNNYKNKACCKLKRSISPIKNNIDHNKSKRESFFEEFVHEHSEEDHAEVVCLDKSSNSVTDENICTKNYDIDLTQNTDSSEEVRNVINLEESPKVSFDASNLGKIGNKSIDYDEMFDDMVQTSASATSQSKSLSSRSNITDLNPGEKPSHSDLVSNSSQNSEVFEVSDQELDYSLHKSRLEVDNPRGNFDFGGISVVDNIPDLPSFRQSTDLVESLNRSMNDTYLPPVEMNRNGEISQSLKSPVKPCSSFSSTPHRRTGILAKTPRNGEYILKTDGVTPMLDYEAMSTPEVNAELDKYGLKPFKRKRAIQLLTHLYNQTHPIVASCSQEESPSKRRKPNTSPTQRISPKKISSMFKNVKSPKKKIQVNNEPLDKVADEGNENENVHELTSGAPVIRNIECEEEEWVFQKREKAKVHSCRVPLHIAFHNYVSTRMRLREAILRYEPVDIAVIHKGLVADGYRFDPKDLLKFMDKKCITVKTADSTKNTKHY